MHKIKLFNLDIKDKSLKRDIKTAFNDLLKNKNYVKGKEIFQFEKNFAKRNSSNYCIACNSGTDALFLILKTLHLKKKDEVIVPANSWISTAETVLNAGGSLKFVDTNKFNNIDENLIEKNINKNTKALIIAHLNGLPCNMDKIVRICKKYKIKLIEDCAQSHFAKYKKKYVGNFGYASAFSFFPTKNIGAFGDSGCVLTNNKKLSIKIRSIANHGKLNNGYNGLGINSRMDTLQAKILTLKLKYEKKFNFLRKSYSKIYNKKLRSLNQIQLPENAPNKDHSFYLYTIKLKNNKTRENLKKFLLKNNIETGVYYNFTLPAIYKYKKKNNFMTAIDNKNTILSLPISENHTKKNILRCCNLINKFFKI